jgi:hypothetical protein
VANKSYCRACEIDLAMPLQLLLSWFRSLPDSPERGPACVHVRQRLHAPLRLHCTLPRFHSGVKPLRYPSELGLQTPRSSASHKLTSRSCLLTAHAASHASATSPTTMRNGSTFDIRRNTNPLARLAMEQTPYPAPPPRGVIQFIVDLHAIRTLSTVIFPFLRQVIRYHF